MSEVGPTLLGPTLALRPPVDDDVERVWEAVQETAPELRPWMAWFHDGYPVDETRQWVGAVRRRWEADEEYTFVITAPAEPHVVLGVCGLTPIDWSHRRADMGYWVRSSAMARGVATEAAALVAHWALGDLGLHRVEIVVAVDNAASQRVAAKVGARREGVARNRFHLLGTAHDAVVFSLVPDDLAMGAATGMDCADDGRREHGREGCPLAR